MIADDEPLVRQGLRMVLEFDGDVIVAAEAADGREALARVAEHLPDLALLDIRMPVLDGIETARRISSDPRLGGVRAVALTTFADDDLVVHALRAGAVGYLLKSMPPEQIRHAVRSAADGQMALAPELVDRLAREYAARRVAPATALQRLTERETQVLREIAQGRSNLEIASSLYLGEGTVKTHVAAVLRKLELRDRTQAAVAAYELGLVRPGGPD
ncbi:response regulator [Pseudactinotalea sp. Z1748]|uniref:response regulator n=1 Tax=Pseudactinotalea sp. Z1748 TaxID=3413027 RepID=UPI003C7C9CCD